jgi:glycosyltransferase involved in cell wall biosynthesis
MASDLKTISVNRTAVITNGFDTEDRITQEKVELDKEFTITYIGTMNDSRNPEVLWKALQQLKNENHEMMTSIKINMIGKAEKIIEETIHQYDLSKYVEFVGYVSHNKAIDYQNSTQLLLLVINRTSNNKSILTGKIFEYIASGRPIVCIGPQDGDAAEIIIESESGVMVDYEDVDKMKQLLESYFAKYKANSLSNEVKSIDKYSRKHLTQKLATLLDEMSSSNSQNKA